MGSRRRQQGLLLTLSAGLNIAEACLVFCLACFASRSARCADWPMWRCDAGHTAASPHDLPQTLHLNWSRKYAERTPVWDDPLNRDLMPYDTVLEPVVASGRMFVGFNNADKLTAIDLDTGRELWTYYADGPVRFSPVASDKNVYFTSDDGCLYCVGAADGRLKWRLRGGPSARKAIGNGRVISSWPARGGPVLRDGSVYFAASIWPFMGTFIYALDADTGRVQWVNDGTGAQFMKQPHSAPSFAGVAPQGQLAATDQVLLVPGGRSTPAAFDRRTGERLYFHFGGKGFGGSFVAADQSRLFVHTRVRGTAARRLSDGGDAGFRINEPVLSDGMAYAANTPGENEKQPTPGVVQAFGENKRLLWQVEADGSGDLIKAGRRLYAAGKTSIVAIDPPNGAQKAKIAWSIPVDGQVRRLLAADGKLLAVTLDGRIMAFGQEETAARHYPLTRQAIRPSVDKANQAEQMLKLAGARNGYAFWFGVEESELLEAVVAASELHVVAVDPRAETIDRLRRRFDHAGLYGRRVSLCQGDPISFAPPAYAASLIVIGPSMAYELANTEVLSRVYESVRPYGGKLWILSPKGGAASLAKRLRDAALARAQVVEAADGVMVARVGALPGSADWTHAYGDIANTVKSNDRLVQLPLGLLWFGGASNEDVLPRHGHGPSEQVLGGRLFIEGVNAMSARDVYTGRLLWKRQFEDLGVFGVYYDETLTDTPLSTASNQAHIPGANARGTNYVAAEEGVYLATGAGCLLLDAQTGQTVKRFQLPARAGQAPPLWGFIGVYRNLLLAGLGFGDYSSRLGYRYVPEKKKGPPWGPDRNGSLGLLAFDRHSGEILWRVDAAHSFLHNGIVAGGGRIYCLDKLPKRIEEHNKRRGVVDPPTYRIVALDAATGKELWTVNQKIFGTWLGYSEQHDILLQAGAAAGDRSPDEAGAGMAAYRGADGKLIWEKPDFAYVGPCMIHNDTVITNAAADKESQGAFRLQDGQPVLIENPITGQPEPWAFTRSHGCGTAVACEHLMTFRSGAAGFYDLAGHGGTGSFGGFRSGCSSNLIAADGVLNAPDYTRTCTCDYQNQTSLALAHMPENEMWTCNWFRMDEQSGPVARLGVNFGAPGDRRSDSGTLWLDYPSVGGPFPAIPIEVEGALKWFRFHSSRVSGDGPPWVAASGAEGVRRVTLRLAPRTTVKGSPQHSYTVRLHFLEPDRDVQPGQRVFDVAMQGKPLLGQLDVLVESGGACRSIVKCFSRVPVADTLTIELQPTAARAPVLSGVEAVREGG